jgi:hypothetical protein
MSLKRGKYHKTEEQYIIDNVHTKTVEELAEHLNRGTDSVERFITKKKLKAVVTQEDHEEVDRLKGILHESSHWEKILMSITDDEVRLFEKDWINIAKQFGDDVWYTEEKYIVDWLLLDLKKYRTLKLEKESIQQIERLEKDLAREYSRDIELRDGNNIMRCEQELAIQKSALTQHNTSLIKILEKVEKIADKLKANREERRDIKANEETYWGYIQMLDDEKFRKSESRQAQLMKMAQDRAREKLYEYHEYMDGTVDVPLLTPEIAIRLKAEEDKYERAETASDNV